MALTCWTRSGFVWTVTGAEEFRDHDVGDGRWSLLVGGLCHLESPGFFFRCVCLSPRVGQDQSLHPIGILPIERKQDVAAHREPHEQGLLDCEMVQQRAHVVG